MDLALSVEELSRYMGDSVIDFHGREAGKLIGFLTNTKNDVIAVEVERTDGELVKSSVQHLKVTDGKLQLLPQWLAESSGLQREYETVTRRLHALESLLKDGEVNGPTYDEMRQQYDQALTDLKARKESLIHTLTERQSKLDQQTRDLESSLTNNKMLYTSGEIEQEAYRRVTESIRLGLQRVQVEKTRLQKIVSSLTNNTPYDSKKEPDLQPLALEKPTESKKIPDFVVVRVKESVA